MKLNSTVESAGEDAQGRYLTLARNYDGRGEDFELVRFENDADLYGTLIATATSREAIDAAARLARL